MTGNRLISTLIVTGLAAAAAWACTSAIVGAGRAAEGRTLLWKHRDTSTTLNFVARAAGPRFDYVALFNAGDSALAEAWAGVNRAGFAVMNTASYNLAPDTASLADREGVIMTMALGSCESLADLERLLDSLPRPLGVQANFGAIDRHGHAAYYETADTGYRRYTVEPDSLMIRTNFSCSGTCGAGLGRERYAAATALLAPRARVSAALLTDTVSCSFWPDTAATELTDRGQYIPRWSTSASLVLTPDGRMRIRPGYPPAAVATYECTIDSIPAALLPGPGMSAGRAWLQAHRAKKRMFRRTADGSRIVNLNK